MGSPGFRARKWRGFLNLLDVLDGTDVATRAATTMVKHQRHQVDALTDATA
jgi:hypothetical protein